MKVVTGQTTITTSLKSNLEKDFKNTIRKLDNTLKVLPFNLGSSSPTISNRLTFKVKIVSKY